MQFNARSQRAMPPYQFANGRLQGFRIELPGELQDKVFVINRFVLKNRGQPEYFLGKRERDSLPGKGAWDKAHISNLLLRWFHRKKSIGVWMKVENAITEGLGRGTKRLCATRNCRIGFRHSIGVQQIRARLLPRGLKWHYQKT
jgi:hypothetical protein